MIILLLNEIYLIIIPTQNTTATNKSNKMNNHPIRNVFPEEEPTYWKNAINHFQNKVIIIYILFFIIIISINIYLYLIINRYLDLQIKQKLKNLFLNIVK
jgi:hypothetical protein